jgi:hypothetical protein
MTADDARTVIKVVLGFWSSPPMEEPEILAWTMELTGSLRIGRAEAIELIRQRAESGEVYRLRPGQIVDLVQRRRRWQALHQPLPALPTGDRRIDREEALAEIGKLRELIHS